METSFVTIYSVVCNNENHQLSGLHKNGVVLNTLNPRVANEQKEKFNHFVVETFGVKINGKVYALRSTEEVDIAHVGTERVEIIIKKCSPEIQKILRRLL